MAEPPKPPQGSKPQGPANRRASGSPPRSTPGPGVPGSVTVTAPPPGAAPGPAVASLPTSGEADMSVGLAVPPGTAGTVTARRAGGLRDMGLNVDPAVVGVAPALQHLAKAVNIAFQSDFGENELESVYQAAIVRRGTVRIVHREYFGYGDNWFGQFGRFLRSLSLTLDGPDPASPEGQRRIAERGPSTIRGLLNLMTRKLDLVAEYEDRVPAFVEQMFDRLEASGIIVGWSRDNWEVTTTRVGLDVLIQPRGASTNEGEAS
ncbi:MAG: hypothetical protein U0794_15175 [Isosphaeraceae bacterium]